MEQEATENVGTESLDVETSKKNEKHLMTLFKCGLFDLVVTCNVVITNDIRNDLSRNVQKEIKKA